MLIYCRYYGFRGRKGEGGGANNDKIQGSSFVILALGVNTTVIIKIVKSINTSENLITEIFGNRFILFATHRFIQYFTVSMLKNENLKVPITLGCVRGLIEQLG
jgi:hypothetical protein